MQGDKQGRWFYLYALISSTSCGLNEAWNWKVPPSCTYKPRRLPTVPAQVSEHSEPSENRIHVKKTIKDINKSTTKRVFKPGHVDLCR